MIGRIRALLLAFTMFWGLAAGAPAQDGAPAHLDLPVPDGPFGIGRAVFDWTDTTRLETQAERPGGHRELLVYVSYPTDKGVAGRRASYFPHLKTVEAYEERFGKNFFRHSYGSSYSLISTITSHAVENARPASGKRRFPVLLFSHGGGIPVFQYTAIIEHLVSHGYIVAAVEHSFDGGTVVFPDGRIISQNGWDDSNRTKEEVLAARAQRYRTGAADDVFVLNQLSRLNSGALALAPKRLRGRLDMNRVGALGHSLGGKISVYNCGDDRRFRICLNLDGGLEPGLTYGPLKSPVVAMFGDNRRPQQPGETAEAFAQRTASRERWVQTLKAPYARAVQGSYLLLIDSPKFSHFSYYDFPDADAEQPPWKATADQWRHNQRIILDFTLAVFDDHLRSAGSSRTGKVLRDFPEANVEAIPARVRMRSSTGPDTVAT